MKNQMCSSKLKERRGSCLQMEEILRRIILLQFMEKLVQRLLVLQKRMWKQLKRKMERQQERMMLMMKVRKVLKGHQRTVKMPPKMLPMSPGVSLVMVKSAPGKKSMKKKMGIMMMRMIIRLRVKVRPKEWLMLMMLREMGQQFYHFQKDSFSM
ncbi:unnamed protein product [Linum tenue]|uniref:Uncharacterized protein n=1 Tax=Linum tenue TaxID=586396 RepID=A0AAV0HQ08_9ROSI|nr:unnamed protein product [Linum tenue]